jgi:hypothetical protein
MTLVAREGESPMSIEAILAPVFVQVALIFGLMVWMGYVRNVAIMRGEATIRDTALGQQAWPQHATQVANCFNNQFQIPMLFFALVPLAIITRKADLLFVVMAWLFVLSRAVHAYIHTTSNRVPRRFFAYLVGTVILLLMWIIFAVRILFGLG